MSCNRRFQRDPELMGTMPNIGIISKHFLPFLVLIPICLASTSSATPPSPGTEAGSSSCDLQQLGAQGRQIARNQGSGLVNVVWVDMALWPVSDPYLFSFSMYNAWRTSTSSWVTPGGGEVFISWGRPDAGAEVNLGVKSDGRAVVLDNSKRGGSLPWEGPRAPLVHTQVVALGWPLFDISNLPYDPLSEPIFPKIDIDQHPAPGVDVFHVAGCDTTTSTSGIFYFVYWRFDGASWSNPVLIDSGYTISQLVMADPTTDEVSYIFCRPLNYASPSQIDNDIAFYKSPDNGLSWVTSGTGGPAALTNVTNYAVAQNGRAYTDLSAIYDFNGVLHIVWNERRFVPPDSHFVGQCELVHWDDASTTSRPIARAFWDNPVSNGQFAMNLCKMTIACGNGWTTCSGQANTNELYVTYTRFGGTTAAELNDRSAGGYMNGELYLSISSDAGHTWSPPRNLTNTKTPGCNPATGDSCASEHWATIAKTVDDTIHIAYIADRDAGAAPLGEGGWSYNPVMYYRIPGGPDGALCPEMAPVLEYLLIDTTVGAVQQTTATTFAKNLIIDNYGNTTLSGNVSVVYTNPPNPPANWLTVGGAPDQSYSIPAGTPGPKWLVVASNLGLDSGVCHAELRITHNDLHQTSPQVLAFQIAGPPCSCPHQGDLAQNGFIDVSDVLKVIQIAFLNGADVQDPICPRTRGDVDNSGTVDVNDVLYLIQTAFLNGPSPIDPCGP